MTEIFQNNRPSPCKGCPDRYPACSGHCTKPAFLAWQEEQRRIRVARKAYSNPVWAQEETDKARYRKSQRRK